MTISTIEELAFSFKFIQQSPKTTLGAIKLISKNVREQESYKVHLRPQWNFTRKQLKKDGWKFPKLWDIKQPTSQWQTGQRRSSKRDLVISKIKIYESPQQWSDFGHVAQNCHILKFTLKKHIIKLQTKVEKKKTQENETS